MSLEKKPRNEREDTKEEAIREALAFLEILVAGSLEVYTVDEIYTGITTSLKKTTIAHYLKELKTKSRLGSTTLQIKKSYIIYYSIELDKPENSKLKDSLIAKKREDLKKSATESSKKIILEGQTVIIQFLLDNSGIEEYAQFTVSALATIIARQSAIGLSHWSIQSKLLTPEFLDTYFEKVPDAKGSHTYYRLKSGIQLSDIAEQ
jgi:hypothetical protein